MEELKFIENKIEEIKKKIDDVGEAEKADKIIKEINWLFDYIRKRDKWIKSIIEMLCSFEERVEAGKRNAKEEDKKKWDEIGKRLFGMRKGVEKEFLYDPDGLLERLKRDGKEILNNSNLAEAIDGIGFRLLEKVRLGQRDDVIYMLLRTFKANEQKMPESLIEALKTKYDDNLFKSFIYAFLNPILGEQRKTKERGEE